MIEIISDCQDGGRERGGCLCQSGGTRFLQNFACSGEGQDCLFTSEWWPMMTTVG